MLLSLCPSLQLLSLYYVICIVILDRELHIPHSPNSSLLDPLEKDTDSSCKGGGSIDNLCVIVNIGILHCKTEHNISWAYLIGDTKRLTGDVGSWHTL